MATNEEHCFLYMKFFSHRHEPLLPEAGIRRRSGDHKVPLQRYIPTKNLCVRTEIMKDLEDFEDIFCRILFLYVHLNYLKVVTRVLATV